MSSNPKGSQTILSWRGDGDVPGAEQYCHKGGNQLLCISSQLEKPISRKKLVSWLQRILGQS